jgi:hypothetical protein
MTRTSVNVPSAFSFANVVIGLFSVVVQKRT